MTQRRGRREARLARMNLAPVLGDNPAQVQHLDARIGTLQNLHRKLDQPIGLRHLPWTGVFAAGRAIDDEKAQWCARILVLGLRSNQSLARLEPVERELIVRIGEYGAG